MLIIRSQRGVPVATVAIDNSINAALLAVRMLSTSDESIRARLEAYSSRMQDEVTAKGQRLVSAGWRGYKA